MFHRNFIGAAIAFGLALPGTVLADNLDVKTGAWEMTTTIVTKGLAMPADAMSGMSAEQQKQMQAMMQMYTKPTTTVKKSCVTKEDLDQDRMLDTQDQEKCRQDIVSKSTTKLVVKLSCSAPEPSTATMTIQATSPEAIVSSIDMVQEKTGGNVHIDMKGRWLGASCAGIEED